jgi:hypothetical protein
VFSNLQLLLVLCFKRPHKQRGLRKLGEITKKMALYLNKIDKMKDGFFKIRLVNVKFFNFKVKTPK